MVFGQTCGIFKRDDGIIISVSWAKLDFAALSHMRETGLRGWVIQTGWDKVRVERINLAGFVSGAPPLYI